MRMRYFAVVASLALLVAAPSAQGAIVDVTYQGTITGGFGAVAGIAASQYVGKRFVAHFEFDTSLGHVGPGGTGVEGGSLVGDSTPLVSASIKVGSFDQYNFTGGYFAAARNVGTTLRHDAYDSLQLSLTTALSGPAMPDAVSPFGPGLPTSFLNNNPILNFAFLGSAVFGPISSLEITTDAIAPVPEPSTWAMMILGFFGVGYMTYRRRNQAAAA